ncbi:gcs-1 [Symbiodinium sp. CCMP2592]|nr:gcs-1 [Symbiodinium sp. CCMP2592]
MGSEWQQLREINPVFCERVSKVFLHIGNFCLAAATLEDVQAIVDDSMSDVLKIEDRVALTESVHKWCALHQGTVERTVREIGQNVRRGPYIRRGPSVTAADLYEGLLASDPVLGLAALEKKLKLRKAGTGARVEAEDLCRRRWGKFPAIAVDPGSHQQAVAEPPKDQPAPSPEDADVAPPPRPDPFWPQRRFRQWDNDWSESPAKWQRTGKGRGHGKGKNGKGGKANRDESKGDGKGLGGGKGKSDHALWTHTVHAVPSDVAAFPELGSKGGSTDRGTGWRYQITLTAALHDLSSHRLWERLFKAIRLQRQQGLYFILEHPEDLGRVPSGERPASIWSFDEVRQICAGGDVSCWALHQCLFGAMSCKPTRLLSNLPGALNFGIRMPCFNDDGDYVGPLLRCPHSHADRACGFQDGTWKSAATAAYPSEFAAFFARLSLSVVPELRAVADSDLIPANIPSSAEAFATECIARGSFDRASVQILFDLLPKTRPHKITGSAEPGTAFFGGTVHQEGLTAPRSTCFTFPESMRVINAFLHSVDPHHRYAAFVLTKNVTSEVHRDPRNAAVPNMIVAISSFTDGGIWIQDDSGTQVRSFHGSPVTGTVHSLQDGPVYLDARGCLHATQPWVGDRLIAIAYTPQNMHLLSVDDSAFLASLGFPVLDSSPAGGEAPAESFVSSDNFTLAAAVPAIDNSGTGDAQEVVVIDHEESAREAFDPKTSRAFGQPMICKFEMGKQEFVDGFGLCSPGRWAPEAREKLASSDEVAHAEGIRGLLRDFVIDQLKDPKDMAFRLATGHVKNSPFAESALQKLRQRIVGLIPGAPSDLLRVPERPRDENTLSDAITNHDFSSFCPELRECLLGFACQLAAIGFEGVGNVSPGEGDEQNTLVILHMSASDGKIQFDAPIENNGLRVCLRLRDASRVILSNCMFDRYCLSFGVAQRFDSRRENTMMDLAAMEAATSSTQLTLPVSYRKFRGVALRNYVLKAMLEGEHASIEDFLERLNEDASAVVGSAVLVDELFRVREALVPLWTEQLTKRCDGDPPWVERLQAMGHFPSTTLWFADGDFGLAPAEAYRDANVQRQRGSREQVAAGLPPSGWRPGAGADAEMVTQPAAGEIEENAELAGPSEVEATNHGDAALPLQPADKEPPSPASPCLLGNMFSKTGPFGAPSESVDFLGGPLGATAQGGSAIEQSCGTDFLGGPIWTVPQAHAYPSASVDHVQPVQQSLQSSATPAAGPGEPMLCVCHDWKRGCRLGEASHPGPGFNLDLGNLGDSLGDSIMKSIKEQIQKAVDEAIKQALASLNLGRGLAAARPSDDPDVQLEPKGRRKRKRKAKQATSHPGGNPDASGGECAGGRQSAAKGKGKPGDKSGPAKVAQRGGPGDSGQRRGKGKGGCGEAGGQEAGDGWQIVRRKAPEGAFTLRKSDWDAPVVEYAALAEFIDKADASKVLELVVFVSADQVTLATNILRGSGRSFKALLVFLSKDEEAQRIPGTIGDRLVFRTAKVQKLTSAGASGHAPQPTGLSQTSIKIKPTESAVVYFKVPKQFASADTWKAFGGNASKAAVDWVAAQRIKVLDTFAWVLEKQRNDTHEQYFGIVRIPKADIEGILAHSGKDGVFVDAARTSGPRAKLQWIEKLPGEKADAYFERALRQASSLGLVVNGGRLAWRSAMAAGEATVRIWHIDGVPHEWDVDAVGQLLEKPLSLWATLAPFRVVSKKQKPLASKAVPVVALEQPVAATIVKPPTGELATGEDGKEVPQQKRVKQEVRTKPGDLQLKACPRDGACVLHALSLGLQWLGDSRPNHPRMLRAQMVEHMRRHATQYEKEWDGKGPDSEPVKDRDFPAYLTLMEKEGAYCSDVELRALGRVLDIKIVVLPAGLNFAPYAFHSKAAKMLVLWYEDNHVDLMLPPEGHKKYPSEYAQITAGSPGIRLDHLDAGERLGERCGVTGVTGKVFRQPQAKVQVQGKGIAWSPDQAQGRATGEVITGTKRKAVELCTSSVFTCTSAGTIEAFDESEFERARVPPKRCPWLAHATAPADLTFRCNLCPYKRKATSNHQYYHIRHNHYQRAHEGQGLQPDIGRPKLTRVCGPRAQFIWCCPFCNKGITHETRKDLSRFSYYALRNQHRAQAHPEVSKAEWQRLAALPQTGPKDRQVHAKGCRQRNLTKAVFAQVRTPRFGDQMQLFVWPRARCEKRSTRVKHVLLEHGWKCLRCGECTRDLAAAKQHSEGRCKSQSNTQKRIQKLDAIEAWARRAGGDPDFCSQVLRAAAAAKLANANPLLAVFVKLLSINANRTAISKVDLCADFLQSCGAELLSLQEADINPLSAQGFGERWRAHGYRAVLSDIDAAKGVHRVALVASLPMHRVNLKLPPHVAARCAAGAFEMQAAGSKCITLVVAFYGFPGQPAATAQALGEVRRAAATFGGPYILLGDFNVDQSEQAVAQLLCDGELRSLDEADWTQAGPTNPTRTRRIDFGLAHWSIIATAVKQFERPHLSDHGCVFYETRCLSRADSFSMPKFRELPATATEDILSNFGRVWDAAHFESSIAGGALDEAWAFLSDVAERTLGATSLFDASGARRSDHWLPCARHESHHRVGPQGHESQSLRSSRKLLGQLHQLRQQPHCQKLWRAVGRRAGLLRATFPDLPVIHAANLAGATQVISHLHAELQQQETEARVHRWRCRVEEDPSRALAWVKRKADHQLAMEQSPQAHAGVPSSVHPASIVEEHGKVWLQHWKPESPVNFDAVQRILDRVPGGPQSDIVLQVEAEALMRATKAMRGKAMGPDRWSAELLLRLPVPWWEAAATLWNAVLSTKYVPRLWRRALIALVPKRLDEYRPIALCPVIWRAGAHCISRNVLPWMDTWLGHHTLGGAPCRGPGDAHARLFHAWQSGGKVFCQQDLTRFFDSLDVQAVGMVLRHLGAPAGLAELLASFYQDASRLFLHEGRSSSAWGSPARGLAQGCPLSPMAAVAVGHICSPLPRDAPTASSSLTTGCCGLPARVRTLLGPWMWH